MDYDNSTMEIIGNGYSQSKDIITFIMERYSMIDHDITITELYIEENTKFDSKDVYCKENFDSKYMPKTRFIRNN